MYGLLNDPVGFVRFYFDHGNIQRFDVHMSLAAVPYYRGGGFCSGFDEALSYTGRKGNLILIKADFRFRYIQTNFNFLADQLFDFFFMLVQIFLRVLCSFLICKEYLDT